MKPNAILLLSALALSGCASAPVRSDSSRMVSDHITVCETRSEAYLLARERAYQLGGDFSYSSGESMNPSESYDVMVQKRLGIDQVVEFTYLDAAGNSAAATHRIIGWDRLGWKTKGDNNTEWDSAVRVTRENYVGTVVQSFTWKKNDVVPDWMWKWNPAKENLAQARAEALR